jgi:tRNA (cmo5U34)-methyltransferase
MSRIADGGTVLADRREESREANMSTDILRTWRPTPSNGNGNGTGHSAVGDGLSAANALWTFTGPVAQHFDTHVRRSVPLYDEGHELICNLSDFFIRHDSRCYEIGSSTGTLTLKLAAHNSTKADARFIGIEIERAMIDLAIEKQTAAGAANAEFVLDDALQFELDEPDLIVAYYTVQFIRPSQRQRLIDRIYRSLKWGGAFLMFEKVRANDARHQDIAVSLYNDFKLRQRFSPDEIVSKARSLKGVLEPFSTEGNVEMLKRAGFVDIFSVMKYVCFEGFLAIK